MALPLSGELGMRSINAELGRTSTSTISLDTAENGGYGAINAFSRSRPSSANPAAISEWYGYDHSAGGGPTVYALPEIGYDSINIDTACRNSVTRPIRVWGDGLVLQDCTAIYGNATATVGMSAGWYSEQGIYLRYWNGSGFTTERACRI